MLPYENLLVTAELCTADLIEIIKEERRTRGSDRMLWPFQLRTDRDGTVTSFERDGQSVPPDARFKIAMNSYDAQSGGQSLMKLREIVSTPAAKLTRIDPRGALIDGLLKRGTLP